MNPVRWRTGELALALTSLSTTAAALWLLTVSVTVLPARDPGHVEFWRTVAVALLAFVAAGLAYLRPGLRGALERVPLATLGVIAAGLGLGAVLRESGAGREIVLQAWKVIGPSICRRTPFGFSNTHFRSPWHPEYGSRRV